VPTVAKVSTDPIVVLQSAALPALLVFLMPFPSQLFNSTLESHEDEVRRWLRLDRIGSAIGGIGAFWALWPGVALFTLLAAVLYGFLDPGFGLDLGSLATFPGMLLGIVLFAARGGRYVGICRLPSSAPSAERRAPSAERRAPRAMPHRSNGGLDRHVRHGDRCGVG